MYSAVAELAHAIATLPLHIAAESGCG